MEIKLNFDDYEPAVKMELYKVYLCVHKETGSKHLIIPGLKESHFIDSTGWVSKTDDSEWIKQTYDVIEEVKFKF